MTRLRLGIGIAVTGLTATVASAQTSSLRGRVTDLGGGIVVNAEVSLRDLPVAGAAMPGMPGMRMPAAPPRTTRSGGDGTFALDQVPAGRYVLQVDAPGFMRSSQEVAVPTDQPLSIALETLQLVGAPQTQTPAIGQAGGNAQALLDRIKLLEDRLADLESSAVLSDPETRVKRIEVWVDANGVEYDRPVEGAKRTVTYQRERVYRRQTINEKIEEALAGAEENRVRVGVSAATATQFTAARTVGATGPADRRAYQLASADVFFTAGLAQNTIFFADIVGLSGAPPDLEVPALTLLNGYTARLVNQNELNLREAWIQTELFGQRLALVAGRVDLANYFDHNAVANDETAQFIGDSLVNNPTLGLVTNGAGFAAVFDPKRGFNFKFGIQQNNTNPTSLSDSILSLMEVAVTATPLSLPEGNYRAWYRVDNGLVDDKTAFGLSVDQKLTPTFTIFGRYGNAKAVGGKDLFYSTGLQLQSGLVIFPQDVWGVGYSRTNLATDDKEEMVEGYYSFRLSERLHLSFHLQHVVESPAGADKFGYLVPGVRLQASF
ncbi:MAG: carboxypeptidase regulatory-like domain-containing protein [Vicinamibacterales bacterium]